MENGFVLVKESASEDISIDDPTLNICFDCIIENSRLILLRRVNYCSVRILRGK